MSKEYRPAFTGYGAFEMKATYQRNMMLGTLSMVLFVTFVIGSFYLVSYLTPKPPTVPIPIDDSPPLPPTDGTHTLDDGVIVVPESGPTRPARPNVSNEAGIPIGVPDSLLADDTDHLALTDEERAAIIDGPLFGDTEGDLNYTPGMMPDNGIPGDDYPEPYQFVPHTREPEIIHQAAPDYPRIAKTIGAEATVRVRVLIDEEGIPLKAIIETSSGQKVGFDEAALEAAMECRFSPALQNGTPVKIWLSFSYDFILENSY